MGARIIAIFLISNLAYAKVSSRDSVDQSADFQNSMAAVRSLSYLDALPGLRGIARGTDGEQLITDLNTAYKDLKAHGEDNPKIEEVVAKYKQKNIAPETAELGTICVVTILGIYGAGFAYIRSKPKLWGVIQDQSGGGCKNKTSQLLNSTGAGKQNAAASAAQSSS